MNPRLLRPLARFQAPPSDPYFSSVSLLLHFDGANNSTSFPDSSPVGHATTAGGDVFISTAQSKFGGASAYFDGTGDGVEISDDASLAFGGDDFTIEAWVYPLNASGVNTIFGQRTYGSETQLALVFYVLSGTTHMVVSSNGSSWAINFSGSLSVPNNQWSHIAMVRHGNEWTIYVDGQVSQTTTSSISVYDSTADARAGKSLSGQDFYGYIDELRITKGVARYTAAFTPPTEAFPNQ